MTNPNQIHVHAYIPDEDGSRFVVDQKGNRPSMVFNSAIHGTYEGTLHAIVQDVATGHYGKIDRRDPSLEADANQIVYRTHTIAEAALRSSAYTWQKASL